MQRAESWSLEQMEGFLEGSVEVDFTATGSSEIHPWLEQVLRGRKYERLGKPNRGLVKRFVGKICGLSRAQVTRLIGCWLNEGCVVGRTAKRRRFARIYTERDILLLASLDEAHEALSGPATKRILEREHAVNGM